MTLETTVDRSGPYVGNGVTTVFAYGFKITDESQLLVMDITTVGGEVELTTGFTVSGVGADSGGDITFAVAPVTDTIIQPRREVPYSQLTDYQNEAAVRPVQVETDFDLMEMQIQQIVGALGLPFPASRASSYLFFDENGDLGVTGSAPNGTYLGAFTTAGEPTTKLSGAALGVGDWYYNTTTTLIRVWTGSAFSNALETGAAIDITGMTAVAALAAADVFPLYDASAAANRKVTLPNLFKGVTALPDLAAVAAVDDTFLVYDLSTTLAKTLDTANLFTSITGLTALTAPTLADELLVRDDSVGGADAARKITADNLLKVINLLTVDSSPDAAADYAAVYDASAGTVKRVLLEKIAQGSFNDVLILRHEQASGVTGGNTTSGAYETYPLNTVVKNGISGAGLTANEITGLAAGTYRGMGFLGASGSDGHILRLYDVTGAAEIDVIGGGGDPSASSTIHYPVSFEFVLSGTSTIRVEQRVTTSRTNGFGVPVSLGTEVYAHLFIWKVA